MENVRPDPEVLHHRRRTLEIVCRTQQALVLGILLQAMITHHQFAERLFDPRKGMFDPRAYF